MDNLSQYIDSTVKFLTSINGLVVIITAILTAIITTYLKIKNLFQENKSNSNNETSSQFVSVKKANNINQTMVQKTGSQHIKAIEVDNINQSNK